MVIGNSQKNLLGHSRIRETAQANGKGDSTTTRAVH
jgi:hypothetical protein